MINLNFFNNEVEQQFYDFLKRKVDKFNIDFIDKIEIHRVESALHNIDVWLGLCNEEISNIKTKENFIAYLQKKRHYTEELKKKAMQDYDCFESYEITMDLLLACLENRPIKNTTSIPTIEEVKNWKYGIESCLYKTDIQRIEALIKLAENYHNTLIL